MDSDSEPGRRIRKILYVTAIDLSEPRGPGVNEREFVASLHGAYGDQMRLLVPKPRRPLPEADRYRVTYLPVPDPKNPLGYLIFQLKLAKTALRLIREEPIDLLVTRPDLVPLGVYRLAKGTKVPIAIKHLTGYPEAFMGSHRGLKRLAGMFVSLFRTPMLRFLAKRSITVDACTEGHIEGIRKNLGLEDDRVILVENATNTDRFRPKAKAEARAAVGLSQFDPIVGYSGGKPWERGGVQLISLLPQLIKRYPKIGVVIVGGGAKLHTLPELAEHLGVSDHVVIPGLQAYDRIPDYVNSFDVGVALDRTDRFDTVGNSNQKVRQYIACGLPVVVTPGGSEFVSENDLGTVVDSSDLDAVEAALIQWLDLTPAERAKHAERAVRYAREHLSVQSTILQRIKAWEAHMDRAVAS